MSTEISISAWCNRPDGMVETKENCLRDLVKLAEKVQIGPVKWNIDYIPILQAHCVTAFAEIV